MAKKGGSVIQVGSGRSTILRQRKNGPVLPRYEKGIRRGTAITGFSPKRTWGLAKIRVPGTKLIPGDSGHNWEGVRSGPD